jgi:type III pantothenate kinase
MLMCFDVGNTEIYCGIYYHKKFINSFRIKTKNGWSSDQIGIFMKSFCRENDINISKLDKIAISSVVPSVDYSLRSACIKYFDKDPLFVKAGIKIGLSVTKFKQTQEIGADLICNAVGALDHYPEQNLLIVDLGTATTISAVNKSREYLTGVIIPGVKTQVESLALAAEKLFSVELMRPKNISPKSTIESIQAGIYYGHLGGIQLLLEKLSSACFSNEKYLIIGTGGFSRLFSNAKLFDIIDTDLTLKGLVKIIELN